MVSWNLCYGMISWARWHPAGAAQDCLTSDNSDHFDDNSVILLLSPTGKVAGDQRQETLHRACQGSWCLDGRCDDQGSLWVNLVPFKRLKGVPHSWMVYSGKSQKSMTGGSLFQNPPPYRDNKTTFDGTVSINLQYEFGRPWGGLDPCGCTTNQLMGL